MKYRIIQNCSKNPLSINGIVFLPLSQNILSEYMMKNIDSIYFGNNILKDLGEYNNCCCDKGIINIDTSCHKDINYEDLSIEIKNSLKRADRAILPPVKLNQLDTTIIDLLNKNNCNCDGNCDLGLITITMDMLPDELLNILNLYKNAYIKPEEGIPLEDFDLNLQKLIINTLKTRYYKNPVNSFCDLPLFENEVGDIRFVIDEEKLYYWTSKNWKSFCEGNGINPDIYISKTIKEFFVSSCFNDIVLDKEYENISIYINGKYLSSDKYLIDKNIITFFDKPNVGDYIVVNENTKNIDNIKFFNIKLTENTSEINLDFECINNMKYFKIWVDGLIREDFIVNCNKIIFDSELMKDSIVNVKYELESYNDILLSQIQRLNNLYITLKEELDFLKGRC